MVVTTCLIAVSGGLGAAFRLALNGLIHRHVRPNYPVAMSIINISGSFVLGLLAGLASGHLIPEQCSLVIGVGLVGGFTAFSATSFQTLRLLQERRVWLAVANSVGMIAVAVLAAGFGIWLGRALAA
ncbi:MAG: CrcB family protein [Microbacteriaceae bacterium]